MRRALLVVPLVLVLTAGSANATPSARLAYARSLEADACPDEAALRSAVARRFGYDPFFAWAKQTVIVQVWREQLRYRSRVQVVDDRGLMRGSRELSGDDESCATLFQTTALAISIALDASAKIEGVAAVDPPVADPPPPTPVVAPPVPVEAPKLRDVPAESAPTRTAHPRGPWQFFTGVAVLGSVNVALSPSAGASAFVEGRWRDLSLAVEGRVDAPATGTASSRPSPSVTPPSITSWVSGGGLVPCLHYGAGALCGVGFLGLLQARSSDAHPAKIDQAIFAAVGGRLALELPLSSALAARAQLDLLGNLTPAAFQMNGNNTVQDAPNAIVTAGAGVAVRFFP
jgi:hypothetical protein